MTCVLCSISCISLVSHNVTHLNLVTLTLFKWSTTAVSFTHLYHISWICKLWHFFILFQNLLTMITMALSTHYTLVSWTTTLFIQLSVLSTLMHDGLWCLTRLNTNKATRTLQTITKLWVVYWTGFKLLLMNWATRSIHNSLSSINVALTVL